MKKVFTSNAFFISMFLISIIGLVGYLICFVGQTAGDFLRYEWFACFICLACEIALFASYQKHNKNLMKGMMGAALMALIMNGLYFAATLTSGTAVACAGLYSAAAILLLIGHFSINSDRHAKPDSIKNNIGFFVLFAVIVIFWFFADLHSDAMVLNLLYALSSIGIGATVVCIEAKLDDFRQNREAAGWTEEAGYPEGYVHEFEKK